VGHRRVINLDHAQHAAPIPAAVLIDRFLFTSAVFGASRQTGAVPDDAGEEIHALFENVEEILSRANAGIGDVARMDIVLRDNDYREAINREWLRLFPDPDDRPARHITLVANLPARAQVQFIAVLPDRPFEQTATSTSMSDQHLDDLGNPA
jgi:2-iminobutanoate/2-iminopropanoate deaminase